MQIPNAKDGQPERYTEIRGPRSLAMIRGGAKALAELMQVCCPPSRELSLALTNLEQAVLWANAAIARNE